MYRLDDWVLGLESRVTGLGSQVKRHIVHEHCISGERIGERNVQAINAVAVFGVVRVDLALVGDGMLDPGSSCVIEQKLALVLGCVLLFLDPLVFRFGDERRAAL